MWVEWEKMQPVEQVDWFQLRKVEIICYLNSFICNKP